MALRGTASAGEEYARLSKAFVFWRVQKPPVGKTVVAWNRDLRDKTVRLSITYASGAFGFFDIATYVTVFADVGQPLFCVGLPYTIYTLGNANFQFRITMDANGRIDVTCLAMAHDYAKVVIDALVTNAPTFSPETVFE